MKTSKAFILRACYVIESATITSVWQKPEGTQLSVVGSPYLRVPHLQIQATSN